MVVEMAEIGQRCDEPLHRKKEGHSTQDTLAETGLGGITHCRWNVCLRWTGHHLGELDVILSVWQCAEVIGTCGSLEDALEGPTSHFWMLDLPKRGQRLPQKGLTSHLLLILCHFSSN
jgi:hypothetical protein